MNRVFGTAAAIALLWELIKPFERYEAYRLGIIDRHGKLLRSPQTAEERNAYDPLTRVAVNLKRLLAKVPAGETQIASLLSAFLLWREDSDEEIDQELLEEITEGVRFSHKFDGSNVTLSNRGLSIGNRHFRIGDLGGKRKKGKKLKPVKAKTFNTMTRTFNEEAVRIYLKNRKENTTVAGRKNITRAIDEILSGGDPATIKEQFQKAITKKMRQAVMGVELQMSESEFREMSNHADLAEELVTEGVNWLPAIHKTLLSTGFTHVQTSPARIHVYHHNSDPRHPLAGARAVASHRGYKIFHQGRVMQGSRQTTLEKHLSQLAGHEKPDDEEQRSGIPPSPTV